MGICKAYESIVIMLKCHITTKRYISSCNNDVLILLPVVEVHCMPGQVSYELMIAEDIVIV